MMEKLDEVARLPKGRSGPGEQSAFWQDGGYVWSRERAAEFGDAYRTSVMGQDAVLLTGEAGMKAFYDDRWVARGGAMPAAQLALLGDGVTAVVPSLDGAAHGVRKERLLAAVSESALGSYLPAAAAIMARYVQRWERKQFVGWNTEMQRLCFAVLSTALVGIEGDDERFAQFQQLAISFRGTEYEKGIKARDSLLAWYREIVTHRRLEAAPTAGGAMAVRTARDAIGILLDAGGLTDEEIVAEVQHMFFGASGVWCLCCNLLSFFAAHPDVRERVQKEARALPPHPSLTTLDGSVYLEQVVKEVSRRSPLIGFAVGRVIAPFAVGEYQIPVGWVALAGLYATNHDPRLYAEPDRFNPDRFALPLDPSASRRDTGCPHAQGAAFTQVAFGGGDPRRSHACLGQPLASLILKLLMISVTRDHCWRMVNPSEKLFLDTATPHPENGFYVEFTRECEHERELASVVSPAATSATANIVPGDRKTRIAVLGGGATGLSVAHFLRKQGYELVTVLERQPIVGGMCESIDIDGRSYNLGGHVCLPSYRELRALVEEMGIEIDPVGWHTLWSEDENRILAKDSRLIQDRVLYRRYQQFQNEYRKIREPGVAARAEHYAAPVAKWLRANDLTALRDFLGLGAFYTAAGYGYLSDDIAAAYFLMFSELINCEGKRWTPRGGLRRLWQRVAAGLDVRCGAQIRKVERREGAGGGVTIHLADGETLQCDRLVITTPLEQTHTFLDASKEEQALFSRIKSFQYYTTVLSVQGPLPRAELTILKKHTDDPATIGHCTALGHYHKDTDIFVGFSYGNQQLDASQVTDRLYDDIRKMGGQVTQLHLQRKWGSYFPHVSSHDMAQGYYARLEALQGQRSTYYAGSLLSFELMECCVAYARRLVERCFAGEIMAEVSARPAEVLTVSPAPVVEKEHPSIVSCLLEQVARHPDKRAYIGVDERAEEEEVLTYKDLLQRAYSVSLLLLGKAKVRPGDRVALVFPPGLDYAVAVWGCLLAGAVAVPCAPPDPGHLEEDLKKFRHVIDDCQCRVALTSSRYQLATWMVGIKSFLRGKRAGWPALEWFTTNRLGMTPYDATFEQKHGIRRVRETLAVLQYTSGSTANPKGVMLTHGNILHNCANMAADSGVDEDSVLVMWVPLFHDLGLTGGAFNTVHAGASLVFISPIAFMKNPKIWLSAIDRFGATHTSAPNFGYEYCLRKTSDAEARQFRLHTLRCAINGGEVPRVETLLGFSEKFYDAGFRLRAFSSGYGMAEHTLFISGWGQRRRPTLLRVASKELEHSGRIRLADTQDGPSVQTLISSGTPNAALGVHTLIVDPETLEICPPDIVGEIWISSPSVSAGYYGKSEADNAAVFRCSPAGDDDPQRRYLRSGDLGFHHEGELYVCGRWKDMIILAGHNLYPQDIEATVADSHPALRPGCCAAFSVDVGPSERLAVVAELRETVGSRDEHERIAAAILGAVAAVHRASCHAIVLIAPRRIFKTTSGKIQRKRCRKAYLDGTLPVVHAVTYGEPTLASGSDEPKPAHRHPGSASPAQCRSRDEAAQWLRNQIAARLQCSSAAVDPGLPFANYGLDSVSTVEFSTQLGAVLGRDLPPTILFDYPSIDRLANHLFPTGPCSSPKGGPVTMVGDDEAIAVIGMGCRFPGGAHTVENFWRMLRDGIDGMGDIPKDRFDVDSLYDPEPRELKMYTQRGACLPQVDMFDADFFEIDPEQADSIDPQHRLLLEVAYEAIENANLPVHSLEGSQTGVFLGMCTQDYQTMAHDSGAFYLHRRHIIQGNSGAMAASRISHTFDLRGPSLSIDTACSSSLYAVHLGCESLLRGEIDMALVGGAHLIIEPATIIANCQVGSVSRSGQSRIFDASADGYAPGEGVGIVLLKRLRAALADGDHIVAVIRGSAVTNAGRRNGVEMPTVPSQEEVIRKALARAGVAPDEVDAVEAHGHAQLVFDAIELSAIERVFGGSPGRPPLCLGSVKSNIGYPYAAGGVAGLMKMCLSLYHQQLPPTLHFRTLNPSVRPFADGNWATVPTALLRWEEPIGGGPRIGGVSSIGMGGSNAHVIVAAPPTPPPAPSRTDEGRPLLLCLSAKTPSALKELCVRYARLLETVPAVDAVDLCYTAALCRTHMKHRVSVVGTDAAALRSALLAGGAEGEPPVAGLVLGLQEAVASSGSNALGELAELAQRYVSGAALPKWEELYRGAAYRKVALPTYPFQRQRYWYAFQPFEVPRYWQHNTSPR